MSRVPEVTAPRPTVCGTPSYFWSCVTLSEDCPFLSAIDPKLYYFGAGLICLYAAFLLIVLADFQFFGSIDNFQNQIDYCINLVWKKVRHVSSDQKRLSTIQERTEKQLKRSFGCNRVVTALRAALVEDPGKLNVLTKDYLGPTTSEGNNCVRPSFLEF